MADFLNSMLTDVKRTASLQKVAKTEARKPITESLQKLAARRLDEELAQFRGKCDSEMKKFSEDPSVSSMRYPAATGPFRMIMHEIADEHGQVSQEFGVDNMNRFVMIYKPDQLPDEETLSSLKKKYKEDAFMMDTSKPIKILGMLPPIKRTLDTRGAESESLSSPKKAREAKDQQRHNSEVRRKAPTPVQKKAPTPLVQKPTSFTSRTHLKKPASVVSHESPSKRTRSTDVETQPVAKYRRAES